MSEDRVAALEAETAELRRRLGRVEDEQAIRRLHHAYGYFMDKWLFREIVDLFTDDVELCFLNGIFRGRAGAERMYFYAGDDVRGPRDGLLFEHLLMQDIITVAPDGLTAKGRFHAIMFVSVHERVQADYPDWPAQFWEGGIHENEYRKENGVWKISRFNYRIAYQADYATGWAHSSDALIMVRPYAGTWPAVRGGPDELREMPPVWPRASLPAFSFAHPVTGQPIAPVQGVS